MVTDEEKAFFKQMEQNAMLTDRLSKAIKILWMQMILVTMIGICVVITLLVVLRP